MFSGIFMWQAIQAIQQYRREMPFSDWFLSLSYVKKITIMPMK
jgi:hypothetical protein